MAYDNGIVFTDEGTVDGQQYVTVLDRGGNPITYHQPRWKANWDFKRRYSPAIAALMDGWDGGDPFGSAMNMAWAIATVSRAIEHYEPAQTLNQRPSPFAERLTIEQLANGEDEDGGIEVAELATAVLDERVTEADLTFAAKVLNRYIDMLDRAGQSY